MNQYSSPSRGRYSIRERTYRPTPRPALAFCSGRVSIAILIAKRFTRERLRLQSHLERRVGDRGAQVILHRHVDRLVRLPMPSAELDIDTPEDLLTLEAGTELKRREISERQE